MKIPESDPLWQRYDLAHTARSNERLTAREREILKLIAKGQNSHEISAALGIEQRVVDDHRNSIMIKLDAINPADLVRAASKLGLVSGENQGEKPKPE